MWGLAVQPLSGPSALLLALAASGLNGQSFAFVGYVPVEPAARAARIRELESQSRRLGQTQIAIETPYRNDALLAALLQHLQPGTAHADLRVERPAHRHRGQRQHTGGR